jgi:1,4-dihydroxy-2-naphthoyl-CoA hydrolase
MEAIEGIERADGLGPLAARMGITLIEASPERVVGSMPVEGNTQTYGLLHGGASCVLAETLGSIGAALYGTRTHGRLPVGVELNVTHHRAARHGLVTGVATPLHLGASIATYEIVITDVAGGRVCTSRLTCFLRRAAVVHPDGRSAGLPGGS